MNQTTPDNNIPWDKGAAYAAYMAAPPPPADPSVEFEKKLLHNYNRSAGGILINTAVSNIAGVVVMIAAAIIFSLQGMSPQELNSALTGTTIMAAASIIAVLFSTPAGVISGFAMTGRLKEFGSLFAKPKQPAVYILLSVLSLPFIQGIGGMLQTVVSLILPAGGSTGTFLDDISLSQGGINTVILLLYILVFAPVAEELLFRGMLMKSAGSADARFAVIFSSLMFALYHGNIMQFIYTFILGLLMSYIDIMTGSLIPSIIVHIANNCIALTLAFFQEQYSLDDYSAAYTVYSVVSLIIGAAALALLLKKLGMPSREAEGAYSRICTAPKGYSKGYTWRLAAKCPCIWVLAAFYLGQMIIMQIS